jgi:signal transduction histidine kinase
MQKFAKVRSSLAWAPRRVLVGFVAAILTLVIVSAATLYGLSRRTADGESVRNTFSVLRTTEELIADVSDSQLALAEFISTGDAVFLGPYESAQRSVSARLGELRHFTASRPEARTRLDRVEPLLRRALERDVGDIAARREGLSIEQLHPMLLESKSILDRSTDELDAFKDDTVRVLTAEQVSLAESVRRSMFIVVAGDVVLLALVVMAAGLALRDAVAKARAVQFQRRVLGIVGHDLRNPLSVITMSAAQLSKTGDPTDKRPSPVSRILGAAHRMESMIRDLLDYSRLELKLSLPLDVRPANVHDSCARIIEEFRAVNPLREILYEPGDDPEVHWDPDRIDQVLANLVGNALKYGQEDAPVRIMWKRRGRQIVIEVHNWGVPIPENLLEEIFEPFRRGRGHDARTAKNSFGLGLYIVRQIVEQHGGEVDVRSSLADGTTFTVTLPDVSATYEQATA